MLQVPSRCLVEVIQEVAAKGVLLDGDGVALTLLGAGVTIPMGIFLCHLLGSGNEIQ